MEDQTEKECEEAYFDKNEDNSDDVNQDWYDDKENMLMRKIKSLFVLTVVAVHRPMSERSMVAIFLKNLMRCTGNQLKL